MIKSYSKINLFLKVLKKNNKDLHNLQSSTMLLDLHDRIDIKNIKKKQDEINFSGKFSKNISKKNNSITKSLQLLRKHSFVSKKINLAINYLNKALLIEPLNFFLFFKNFSTAATKQAIELFMSLAPCPCALR